MLLLKRSTTFLAMILVAVAASLAFVDDADARRGGSFGSRGARTYSAPAVTPTAPRAATPIQRSMTQPSQAAGPAAAAQATRPGFFGGFGGSMLRGLAIGGLIGLLLGHGFGGLAGGFGFILQIALLAIGAMFLMRFFANRNQPAPAGLAPNGPQTNAAPSFRSAMSGLGLGGSAAATRVPANARNANDEVGITDSDLEAFEKRLDEIQQAFGREDYSALRERTTPEIMSYLSEELSQNATAGVRNEVTNVKLLQGDLAEAWQEGDTDYATVAMRYESRDWMRDRSGTRVISGDSEHPTETTELWTFSRQNGGEWKLSAIQEL